MNTNRDASAHTRRLAARTITMDHILNPVRKGQNTDMAASFITKIQLGPADNFLKASYEERVLGILVVPAPVSAPAPAPAPAPGPSGINSPTGLIASSDDGQLIISFTDGSSINPITNYLWSSDGTTFTAFSPAVTSGPVTITGLTNATAYTIYLKATDGTAESNASLPVTAKPGGQLAPVLTGVSFKTTTSMTLTFTQASNGMPAVTNYKYSLDGVTYTAFSPVDAVSPVTISGLSPGTEYTISLKAVNSNGDSVASNILTATTYTNVNYVRFTTVGTTTWTAPENVTFVQYLIVGGGGGGGAAYSQILVLGNIQYSATDPSPTTGTYYIKNTGGSTFDGYFFKDNSTNSVSMYIQATAPQNITPNGTSYAYNRWYGGQEMVYFMNTSFPTVSNATYANGNYTTANCNNISGGGGGGAGGRVLQQTGTTKYDVTPGATYTVVVGAGGAGGVGGTNTETAGSAGGSSSFDSVIAPGGSGGSPSHVGSYNTNGYNNGGNGGQSGGNLAGGGGGQGMIGNGVTYTSITAGGAGGSGGFINFDGNGSVSYATGGVGGAPNTVASGSTAINVGKGGMGTGCTLNSYANGIDGGSGIVMLRYYT